MSILTGCPPTAAHRHRHQGLNVTQKTFTISPTAKIDKVEAPRVESQEKTRQAGRGDLFRNNTGGVFFVFLFFSQRKRAERHLGCRLTETPELSCQKSGCRDCSSLKLALKKQLLPLSMQDKQETLLYGLHSMVNTLKSLSRNCFLSNRRSYTNKMHKKKKCKIQKITGFWPKYDQYHHWHNWKRSQAPEITAVSSKPHGR